jgi:phosphatidylglycerol:prolipoprotein diacylglycerol transferase
MVALAFIAGIWTATRRCPKDGLRPEVIADLGPWLIVAGLVGARILYVITYWKESFSGRPWWEVFMVQHGGLVFYGGLIGAVLTAVFYVKWKNLPPMKVGDAMAPSIALGHVFGRIGCLMNGCCYGAACSLPWAIHFPKGHETAGQGVHPTQLYEAGLNLILYIALEKLYRKKRFDGQVFGLYLVAYAVLRVGVELFRGDYGTHRLGIFTPGQVVSAVILVAGLTVLWIQGTASRRKVRA